MMNGKKLLAGLGAAAILLTGIGAYGVWNGNRTASIVQLDVNPSVELHVDNDGDVLRTSALNPDGEKILEGMKLKGTDADTAVNAIVGSLLRHGYIDELANSILLTVDDENTARGTKLKEELTEEINAILNATAVQAAILSQDMKETALAEQENISQGKATLIENIVAANGTYKAEELADLSVNELNLIVTNSKNKVENVASTGNAAENAYIGKDKAKAAAFAHAKVKEADVSKLEVEMDYDYKVMVYEVDFASGEYEYDYTIDAKSGEVLHSHREYDDDYVAPVAKQETTEKKESATEKKKETQAVKKEETSATNNNQTSNKKETSDKKQNTTSDIGRDKAKSVALSHAGVKESATSRLVVEREYDDGRLEYHVEFRVGNKEYDYEILASNGKILDYDVDVEKEKKTSTTEKKEETKVAKKEETSTAKKETSADIGRDKAKSIALNHAGVKESATSRLKVERDLDDGRIEYSVEFTVNGKEYDYEISGSNGKILDYDVEAADRD